MSKKLQLTLAILKPDLTLRPYCVEHVRAMLLENDFIFVKSKEEHLDPIKAKSHDVGISLEIKSPTALNKILKDRNHETTAQKLVIDSLKKHGYTGPNDKCLLQCFELSILEEIKGQTEVNRVFLLKRLAKTDEETLKRAQNADVFSVCLDKELLISTSDLGYIENINQDLYDRIHALGMQVYAYTFKNDEIAKLKWDYHGDVRNELQKFYELGKFLKVKTSYFAKIKIQLVF